MAADNRGGREVVQAAALGGLGKLRVLRATGVCSWAGERQTRKVRQKWTRPPYSWQSHRPDGRAERPAGTGAAGGAAIVGGAIHTQDRQRLVQDMRPKSKDSHGKSFKFFDRFHPQTANPATRASRNVMDFVQRTRLLENIETLMVKYLRDRNVSEATLRRTEPKAHMFFAHCYGARKRDGMKFHVDDVSHGAAVYCVSWDNGERGLYWATSDNEETCDVIEVPLQPGDLAFIISGTHHGVHHVTRKVPRITLNIFMWQLN